ncbi:sensor histidine kinase [Amycolatopsis cihanbeyliensis]|uniref:histidine kinase n=1 Tax=Amycolatopsis cihanbeyliensis TaxID=1128664 RepID=A0A542DK31_AMYCI|nr:histidine kinase [Amycolatopsis cihanbeyliensis]TQJ03440.1 histidine kinase [Amycolatopsis cihanbeyliensis]
MTEAKRRWRLPDNLAPGWLVVQLFGTVFLAATLLTAREDEPWIWACYGACAACWTVFVLAGSRAPRFAAAMLGVAAALPTLATGPADDMTPAILGAIALGRFAALEAPGVTTIVLTGTGGTVLATASGVLAGLPADKVLGTPVVLLLFMLFGLHQRQYRVRARQAEQLLEQTRLAQAEHARAAALDERTRIAREIHDVLAHSLGALGVQLELAEAQLAEKSDVDGSLGTVRRARRLASDGLAEARNAVAALRRDVPALTEALAELAARHRRDHGTPVDFRTDGVPRAVSSATAVSLSAGAREALTNAARHAPGAAVTMVLGFGAGRVSLRVVNERTGARPARAPGFGLTGLRERIALAGGTLTAGSEGRDWRVSAEVPDG